MFVTSWAILLVLFTSDLNQLARANQEDIFNGATQAIQDYIFNGVRTIRVPGVNCLMTVFGELAFPLAAGSDKGGIFSPMGAGGTFGSARMVGFSLDHILYPEDPTNPPGGSTDQNRFLMNLYKWLASGKNPNTTAFIGRRDDRALQFLEKNSMKPTVICLKELAKHKSLRDFDVVVIRDHFTIDHVPLLRDYVNGGGGIAAAFDMVQWMSKVKVGGAFATNFPPNMLSKNFGFVWRDDNYDTRSWVHNEHGILNVTFPALVGLTFFDLWNYMKDAWRYRVSPEELPRLFKALEQTARSVPKNFFVSRSNFYAVAVSAARSTLQPIPNNINWTTRYHDQYKLLLFDCLTAHVLKPEDVPKHPSSKYFPGLATRNTTQTQVFWRKITLNKDVDAWYSTGLYAEAGKVVTVKLAEYSSPEPPIIELRIGSETGDLSRLAYPPWKRATMKLREIPFENRIATFNTPYGGAIYVVGFGTTKKGHPLIIKLVAAGAISAPYFELGETSVEEWLNTSRKEPAPWAELVSENVILSVPSADIRNLEDPDLLLDVWSKAADTMADFVQISPDLPTPIRISFNVQLSKGNFFFMDQGARHFVLEQKYYSHIAVDLPSIMSFETSFLWFVVASHYTQFAFFINRSITNHALCHLFVVYFYEKLMGLRPAQTNQFTNPFYYQPIVKKYADTNLTFMHFLRDEWLGLTFFMQLKEKYDWEIFQQTFVEYRNMPDNEKPKDEEEIMNLWVLLTSKSVKRNLYEFHESWRFPLGRNLKDNLSRLNYPMDPMRMEDLIQDYQADHDMTDVVYL